MVISLQLELQRQQLLADRQQFQRDQLKAAELRSLQSPTLGPTTPLQFPPSRPPHRSPTLMTPAQPTATMAIIQAEVEGSKVKLPESDVVPMDQSDSVVASTATAKTMGPVGVATEKQESLTTAPETESVVKSTAKRVSIAKVTLPLAESSVSGAGGEDVMEGGGEETKERDGGIVKGSEELLKEDAEAATTEMAPQSVALPVTETTPPEAQAPPTTSEPPEVPIELSGETASETTPTNAPVIETTPTVDEPAVDNETTDEAPSTSVTEAISDATPTGDEAPPTEGVTGSSEVTVDSPGEESKPDQMEVREGEKTELGVQQGASGEGGSELVTGGGEEVVGGGGGGEQGGGGEVGGQRGDGEGEGEEQGVNEEEAVAEREERREADFAYDVTADKDTEVKSKCWSSVVGIA